MSTTAAKRILVVEDNPEIGELVEMHLRDEGWQVRRATDGHAALQAAESDRYDLVVLDLMLPGVDGLTICQRLRAGPHYVPILMLTAKSSELDRVVGLEMGADDYLSKPFSVRELVARIKALFRRVEAMAQSSDAEPAEIIESQGLRIDVARRTVTLEGQPVNLTAKEFDLLLHFASHPGRVYSRTQLLDQVWGYGHEGYEHTVNSHINRLRAKVETDPAHPRYVLTVWGVGYKFTEN